MHIIGKYKKLTGIEKKELVIILINQAIDYSELNQLDKEILKLMMERVIPDAIDVLVNVSKKKI